MAPDLFQGNIMCEKSNLQVWPGVSYQDFLLHQGCALRRLLTYTQTSEYIEVPFRSLKALPVRKVAPVV